MLPLFFPFHKQSMKWQRQKNWYICKSIGIYIGLNWKQYCHLNKWLLMLSFLFDWENVYKKLVSKKNQIKFSTWSCCDFWSLLLLLMLCHWCDEYGLCLYNSWTVKVSENWVDHFIQVWRKYFHFTTSVMIRALNFT